MRGRCFSLALSALVLLAGTPSHAAEQVALAAPAAANADPAQLAVAESIAGTVFPNGTYKRIMGETMSKMMDGMMNSMMKLPMRDIVAMTGLSSEKIGKLDNSSIQEIAEIVDPHFNQRMRLVMDTMFTSMGEMMTQYEPRLRAALTRSFARKFDLAELTAIRSFFGTPAGTKFASDYMTMFLEPEIMGEMQGMMPEMVKKMPELLEPATKAAESLPPSRKISELSGPEQDKLAKLLGVAPAELRKSAARAEKEEKQ